MPDDDSKKEQVSMRVEKEDTKQEPAVRTAPSEVREKQAAQAIASAEKEAEGQGKPIRALIYAQIEDAPEIHSVVARILERKLGIPLGNKLPDAHTLQEAIRLMDAIKTGDEPLDLILLDRQFPRYEHEVAFEQWRKFMKYFEDVADAKPFQHTKVIIMSGDVHESELADMQKVSSRIIGVLSKGKEDFHLELAAMLAEEGIVEKAGVVKEAVDYVKRRKIAKEFTLKVERAWRSGEPQGLAEASNQDVRARLLLFVNEARGEVGLSALTADSDNLRAIVEAVLKKSQYGFRDNEYFTIAPEILFKE